MGYQSKFTSAPVNLEKTADQSCVVDGAAYEVRNDILILISYVGEREQGKFITVRSSMCLLGGYAVSKHRWNLDRIEAQCFKNMALSTYCRICIPSSVESIGKYCFDGCGFLCEVTFEFGSKLQRIEKEAFRETHLKTIRIPASVELIGESCFDACHSLYDVVFEFGSKLQRIEESAFQGSGLKMIRIPSSVEFIGDRCFAQCNSLCEIRFECESSLKEMGKYVFYETNLKGIEIPKKCEIMTGASLIGLRKVVISNENPFFVKSRLFGVLTRKSIFDILECRIMLLLVNRLRSFQENAFPNVNLFVKSYLSPDLSCDALKNMDLMVLV
jgi:hypothetical protein